MKEIDMVIVGLRRSGIHAIASWLIPHLEGTTRLVNDYEFDPTKHKGVLRGTVTNYFLTKNGHTTEFRFGPAMLPQPLEYMGHHYTEWIASQAFWKRPLMAKVYRQMRRSIRKGPQPKALIDYQQCDDRVIANHNVFVIENMGIGPFCEAYSTWKHEVYQPFLKGLGMDPNRETYIIQIVREPWNQLASLLKRTPMDPPRPLMPDAFLNAWLDYGREYVKGEHGQMNALERVVRISYPEWFTSESYRMSLAMQMGLEATDYGMNTVPNFGGGSSFDLLDLSGQAHKMQVLSRWKAYQDHPLMHQLCANDEVKSLIQHLFNQSSPKLNALVKELAYL
jgi:hypothetical protein